MTAVELSRAALVAVTVTAATAVMGVFAGAAQAKPVKLVLEPNRIAAGFEFPRGVAVAPGGDLYVVDRGHFRVQELTPAGQLVLMFGREVNKKGGDVCTAAEASECQTGVQGLAPGQFSELPSSIVASAGGDVYVAEVVRPGGGTIGERVQQFTAEGKLVREFGREVNETTKGNVCSQEEVEKAGVKCTSPRPYPVAEPPAPEHGAFEFEPQELGNLLAIGGPKGLLYVGENGRVQELEASGNWVGEIPTGCPVGAIAVDNSTGDVYTACYEGDSVQEFGPGGSPIRTFLVGPRETGNEVSLIEGLALDSSGHLAVTANELLAPGRTTGSHGPFGSLFEGGTGSFLTHFEFEGSHEPFGMAFNESDEMYATVGSEVLVYKLVDLAELIADGIACGPGADRETDATLDCTLNGRVDPWGVSKTEVWFQWGPTPLLGNETLPQAIENAHEPPVEGEEEPFASASALVQGIRPNTTLYARMAGKDANVSGSELLLSEGVSARTPLVAPRILGEPVASFVTSSSAVFYAELNPENADTTYEFQYAPCETLEGWAGAQATYSEESALYGLIGTTIEARGLRPSTRYCFRLIASNEQTVAGKAEGGRAEGAEGTFTTAAVPAPTAATGQASAVGTTYATISGTVDPNGQPATYSFELGVYEGASTRYGTVLSASAGAGTTPVSESFQLTGLQPGTTYAYRIAVAGGHGTATGEPVVFTTEGLPVAIQPPQPMPVLPAPPIAPESEPGNEGKKPVHEIKSCKKLRKKQRSRCERATRRKGARKRKHKK